MQNSCDFNTDLKLKGFKVYEIISASNVVRTYNRKDFYKICLNTGENLIHYADRSFQTKGSILFFGNPHIPYSWESITPSYKGYACLFTEDFVGSSERSLSLQQSPLFKLGGTPIFNLDDEQRDFAVSLFKKMIAEEATDYAFKDDLMRNYINLLIHEALRCNLLKIIRSIKMHHHASPLFLWNCSNDNSRLKAQNIHCN